MKKVLNHFLAFLHWPFSSTLKNCLGLSLILIIIFPYAYHKALVKRNDFKSLLGQNILVIPKIAFTKAYFPNDEAKNNLTTGIISIKPLNDVPLLLASHSGDGLHSYFKDLEKLEINDEFYLKENNQEKKYQIIAKKYKEKNGILNLKSKNKDLVILLTCSKLKKDQQVYYIGQKIG